jgi:predicted transcriptional regulator
VTPEAIAEFKAMVKDKRPITVNELAAYLDMSHGPAYHIVHDFLQFHKYLIN